MTTTYKIAEEIANEILKASNEKYKALKKRDLESYDKFNELELNLRYALKGFGYEVSLEREDSPMVGFEGRIAFKWCWVRSISEIKEEN